MVMQCSMSVRARAQTQPTPRAVVSGVEVRTYKVIYDLLDDMRAAMEGQLRSVEERIPLGAAEVRLLFECNCTALCSSRTGCSLSMLLRLFRVHCRVRSFVTVRSAGIGRWSRPGFGLVLQPEPGFLVV